MLFYFISLLLKHFFVWKCRFYYLIFRWSRIGLSFDESSLAFILHMCHPKRRKNIITHGDFVQNVSQKTFFFKLKIVINKFFYFLLFVLKSKKQTSSRLPSALTALTRILLIFEVDDIFKNLFKKIIFIILVK